MSDHHAPRRMLRIALVSEHASPLATLGGADAGGQNVHVAELARALAGRGHRVEVYTRRDAPGPAERVRLCPGVDVVHVEAGPAAMVDKDELLPWMDDFGRRLAERWTTDPPDLVHAHFWMSGLAALAAGREVGVPVALTFHALGAVKRRHQGAKDGSPAQRVDLEKQLAADVDAVIATCRDEVAELTALGAPAASLHVVPCGVDVRRFTPHGPARSAPPGRPARHRLLSIGRLVERKGLDTAVRALVGLPDCELIIAGGPPAARLGRDPEARRLRALATELGVAGRLELVGGVTRAQMPALLRGADLVLVTPWYEPFGIIPLEAAACGRPVVGTAVGGLLDTVVPGTTGTLVPSRAPAALAAAVRVLLDDPARREAMGRAARLRAVEHYSWPAVAEATEGVYRTVLAAHDRVAAVSG